MSLLCAVCNRYPPSYGTNVCSICEINLQEIEENKKKIRVREAQAIVDKWREGSDPLEYERFVKAIQSAKDMSQVRRLLIQFGHGLL